jgi:hypothetical protein
MISPLGQRQIFQTANIEAVKQAQDVSEQIQRENARKRIADERLQEDEASVRVIDNSEKIQTDERKGRGGQDTAEEELPSQTSKDDQDEENPAESADSHLDFLA